MKIKFFIIYFVTYLFVNNVSFAEEKDSQRNSYTGILDDKTSGLNVYSGMFDFSDDGQRASLIGIEHQNQNLYRNTLIGKISPVTGFFITENNASYIYTGIETNYKLGRLNITPSFTPGIYNQGNGKDLGHIIEFKSEIRLSMDLSKNSMFGMSYNHISNASLGSKNPGANSYMFNFLKKF